jgi:ferrochelatase
MKAVVLAGFGGPEKKGDIRPFLEVVLRGRPVPPHRIDEVVGQYEQIGGRSPYNDLARSLASVLEERFRHQNVTVSVGMRNGPPTMADTLADLKRRGVTDVVAVVLAAYRSIPSWNYYLQTMAQAIHGVGKGLRVRFVSPYFKEERFVKAVSARVHEALDTIPTDLKINGRGGFLRPTVFLSRGTTIRAIPSKFDSCVRGWCRGLVKRTGT